MFSPDEQQIKICLLKTNLEKIGDDLVVQNSALPALDAENELKHRETMTALRVTRSLNAERERLNLENVKLTAKRMQLKQQCGDITKALERAREHRERLADSLKREENDIEIMIRHYEDILRNNADRFRKTSAFYNEEQMQLEMDKVTDMNNEFEKQLSNRAAVVEQLKLELDELVPSVPEDVLDILGKAELEKITKKIYSEYENFNEKLTNISK